jgi:hypothetical protein
MKNEQILQKYVNSLSQKTYDCFYLETQLESLDKLLQDRDKEIERLKKMLDDNNIDYKGEHKCYEVALSPVENMNEEEEN